MCVVSMIYDHYRKTWPEPYLPEVIPPWEEPKPSKDLIDEWLKTAEGRRKQEELERRVREMEELLKKAKIYDEENNQPDCESESKKKTLQDLAEAWNIEINFPD